MFRENFYINYICRLCFREAFKSYIVLLDNTTTNGKDRKVGEHVYFNDQSIHYDVFSDKENEQQEKEQVN